uniref:MADF domain-containing protein n=1 Tax=Ditylenchus dipsaci TaxID=166011 RepID=A0A915D798_9BILA
MWPTEDVVHLIEEYSKRPVLWCTTHENYNINDGLRRMDDIVAIRDGVNLITAGKAYTKIQIKDKIKTLRYAYQRRFMERKRKPEWDQYFDMLSFLDGHIEIITEQSSSMEKNRNVISCNVIAQQPLSLEDLLQHSNESSQSAKTSEQLSGLNEDGDSSENGSSGQPTVAKTLQDIFCSKQDDVSDHSDAYPSSSYTPQIHQFINASNGADEFCDKTRIKQEIGDIVTENGEYSNFEEYTPRLDNQLVDFSQDQSDKKKSRRGAAIYYEVIGIFPNEDHFIRCRGKKECKLRGYVVENFICRYANKCGCPMLLRVKRHNAGQITVERNQGQHTHDNDKVLSSQVKKFIKERIRFGQTASQIRCQIQAQVGMVCPSLTMIQNYMYREKRRSSSQNPNGVGMFPITENLCQVFSSKSANSSSVSGISSSIPTSGPHFSDLNGSTSQAEHSNTSISNSPNDINWFAGYVKTTLERIQSAHPDRLEEATKRISDVLCDVEFR